MPPSGDFGVEARRDAVLDAWRASPTRLLEDARTEADLAEVGYRDRLFTELAANAADAAGAGPGRMAVWRDAAGALHAANTGEPLTADGVASLLAMRVSAKEDDPDSVGRFGVGFAAVVPVADRVEIRSRTGSIVFDRARTRRAVDAVDLDLDGLEPPLLRLAWSGADGPREGFDTEIVLTLRTGVDVDALLADIAVQACDRLLELPALGEIAVADDAVVAVRKGGEIRFDVRGTPLPGAGDVWREAVTGDVRWLLADGADPADGRPVEVLRTPTPTDIELSVPARVIAALPVTPDRRHLMPDVDVAVLAPGYVELVKALAPRRRPALVPRALGRNPVDTRLLEAIGDELKVGAWVPPADGEEDLAPERTVLIADLSDDLAHYLGPVLATLAHPSVSGPDERAALIAVGAREIGLADIAQALADVDRPPSWWQRLYDALSPLVATGRDAEELGALPVPRSDGRRNLGARGLVLTHDGVSAPWAATVAPEAAHPLLERLGARPVGTGELLAGDDLVAALADAAEHGDDDDVAALSEGVLGLLAADSDAVLPAAAAAELLLPDRDGGLVHVDELLMVESPLAAVLGDDLPFAFVDESLVQRYGTSALRRAGVGWGFLTVVEDWPTGPDHDLDDEERWWSALAEPPATMAAVRDLDLVPEDRWPQALTLLAEEPATAPLLADPDGYTAWWLRDHASVDGRRLGDYRSPDAEAFADVVDPLDHPSAAALSGVLLADTVVGASAAAVVLANLGDPDREIAPGTAVRAYGAVVDAVRRGDADVDAVIAELGDPPAARAVDGSVCDDAIVVDAPHYVAVLEPGAAVLPGLPVDPAAARELAALLDLPLAGEAVSARVVSNGRATTWDADVDAIAFAAARGAALARGTVVVHDDLVVATDTGEHHVAWWLDETGTTHLSRP
ncbi:sacsin N-terminal ATP-binding-like domain-containing protein [Gordonia sp. (in: high G+C Gram-positive bacteria)]|uniref:sacsin N-terminal ATP-binding-like domain-containing protein n=1 Tax=Gordonia sp. (in: high G+C Gram-positive bacteria) TaxID=84139 RepID=UPI0039E2CE36